MTENTIANAQTKPLALATVRLSLLIDGLNNLTTAACKESSRDYIGTTKSESFLCEQFDDQMSKSLTKANGTLCYRQGAREVMSALNEQADKVVVITQLSSKCVKLLMSKLGPLTNLNNETLLDEGTFITPLSRRDVLGLYKEVAMKTINGSQKPLGPSVALDFEYTSVSAARLNGFTPIIFTGLSTNPAHFSTYVEEAGAQYTSKCLREIANKVNKPEHLFTSRPCIMAPQPV